MNLTDNEIIKANDILDKFDFFNQRAGRELWSDKPKDIQDKDIENFSNDVKFLKDLINRQKAEIERFKKIETTVNEFWGELQKLSIAKGKEKPTLEELLEYIEQVKAESTEQLLKKIESRLANNTDISNVQYQSIIFDISEACKEMVGEG